MLMIQKRGFTLIEGLIVMAIISIFMAMLLPVLKNARDTARSIACLNNLHQTYLSSLSYAEDNGNWIHASYASGDPYNTKDYKTWANALRGSAFSYQAPVNSYVGIGDIMVCPSYAPRRFSNTSATYAQQLKNTVGLHANYDSVKIGNLSRNAVIYMDSVSTSLAGQVYHMYSGVYVHLRHPGRTGNGCFPDGHVKNCQQQEIKDAGFSSGAGYYYSP